MNFYRLITFLTTISYFGLGAFVYLSNPKRFLHKIFLAFCCMVSLWSFGYFLTLLPQLTYQQAMIASRFSHAAGAFIPITFLHMTLVFIDEHNKHLRLLIVSYFISTLSFLGSFTALIVRDLLPKMGMPYYPEKGSLYPIYTFLYFIFGLGYSQFYLFRAFIVATGTYRKRLVIFIFSSFLGFVGGITLFLLIFNIPFPPYASVLIVLYPFVMSYSIVRFREFDINIIIKRTIVFAGLMAFVFSVFSVATFFVKEVLTRFGANDIWTYGSSLIAIVFGYDHIRNILIDATDKYLFQKKYNYQQILKDASRGMSKIESLQHLLGLVAHFVTMRMRIRNAAVLMKERRSGEFELVYQRGYEKNFLAYHLDDTNPLINYLQREREPVEREKIHEYIEAGNKKKVKGEQPHSYDFGAILGTMQEIQAACVVPSFLGRELRNILVLGEKKSGDYYTTDDLNVLMTLAQESAIAIENARLYDEALGKTQQLEKINEQLEFSKTLLMKALHETEIANKQLQDTQAQLIHEQKMATLGRLAASVGHEVNNPLTILSMNVSRAILKYRKNPDLRVGEVLDLFQKMEQNIGRIKAVVNTLTGLLRRSEKGKFEPLSLKLILEETLPLVQFQTYLDNLTGTEVEFDIPGNIPLIRGDLERLQEVFLNLFINAYHAMAGKRNRKIRVTAEPDTANPLLVAIHFGDNGSGMSEEVMKKIFNYGFTTKPPGKGSGLGLYMCKYIVELHGGEMKVSSKLGEGTTFTIYLPIHEESSSGTTSQDDARLQAGGG